MDSLCVFHAVFGRWRVFPMDSTSQWLVWLLATILNSADAHWLLDVVLGILGAGIDPQCGLSVLLWFLWL